VHVVLDRERERVVDDVLDVGDVEAPRRHVGGDQDRAAAGLEALQRVGAVVLVLVAVNRWRERERGKRDKNKRMSVTYVVLMLML
jgi:hypothetical protein